MIYDVAVDLRCGSDTFGKYYGIILDSQKQNQFYIPEGFAHGFLVLSDEAIFAYKCTDFYDRSGEGGMLRNDSTVNVNWNEYDPSLNFVLSDKDKLYEVFTRDKKYFDLNGKWICNNS